MGRTRRVLSAIVRPVRTISLVCSWIAAWLLAALVALQIIELLARNLLGRSLLHGTIEYISIGLVLMVFLSVAHAERLGVHVRTPLLTSRLPRGVRVPLRGSALIAAALVIWFMAYASFVRAVDAMQAGEVLAGVANVPSWQARFAVPLGALLLGLELVARALDLDGEAEISEEDAALVEGSIL